MNRIRKIFENDLKNGKKTLVGYATAGCPGKTESLDFMRGMVEGGVGILELGIPFSDPMADGTVIQESSGTALRAGTTLNDSFSLAKQLRKDYPELGLVMFSYYNPIFHRGVGSFAEEAAKCGVDAVLIVDVPLEERAEVEFFFTPHGIELVPLVSPATPLERMKKIVEHCGSFVYYITVKGVTGTRMEPPEDLQRKLAELKSVSTAPVAAGFGISNPEMARAVSRHADGIVIGSAFVRIQNDTSRTSSEKREAAKTFAAGCVSAMNRK